MAKCKYCKKKDATFKPTCKLSYFCDIECALAYGIANKDKGEKIKKAEERKELKKRKEALNDTIPIWTKKAQKAFNAFIRERDKNEPCISCGKLHPPKQNSYRGNGTWDAGHYRSIGSCPELRFDENNCHKQLSVLS